MAYLFFFFGKTVRKLLFTASTFIMTENEYKQTNREAFITLGLYAFFFVWWTAFAFILGSGSPDGYAYVFGIPAWFFWSCIAGYPVITVLLWIVVRRYFKNIPISHNSEQMDTNENNGSF